MQKRQTMFFIAKRAFHVAVQAFGLALIFGSLAIAADRPPLVGIAHIAFQVSDLVKAQAFYGGLLGYDDAFRLYKEDGTTRLVYFKVNDRQYIEIFPGLPPEQDDRLSHIALETTNLEALRLYLAEKGVQVPQKINQGQDGNLNFTVKDPDGHRVEFVQYQSGSVQMKAKGSYLGTKRLSSRMLHVGVTVADVGAADRFYKDVLGFSEIWRGGTTDDVTSWINMKVPDGTDYVEYMLVTGEVDRKQLGTLHHAALLVPDMQQALETLRERPLGWDPAHVQVPRVGRNKRWQLNLYDSDGSRTELMEPFTMR
jgi:lactoylglutathione lyase